MSEAAIEMITKAFIWLMFIIFLIMCTRAFLVGTSYSTVMRITGRIDDINATLVAYAQKNGGIDANTPEFSYAKNIDELKEKLIQEHRLSSKIVTPSDIKIIQTSEPGLRGSIVKVETSFRIPIFVTKVWKGGFVYKDADPRTAEGVVHQYKK